MVVGLACLGAAFVAGCEKQVMDTDIVVIGGAEVRAVVERGEVRPSGSGGVRLLDCRTADRFEQGRIPGSINFRAEQLRSGDAGARLKDANMLIVYGENPASGTAKALVKRLMALDYPRVRWYAGGYREWSSLKLPVEGRDAAAGEGGGPPAGEDDRR